MILDGQWMDIVVSLVKNTALAIAVLVIGLIVIKGITRWMERKIVKSRMDDNLKPFITTCINASLKVLLALSIIKILGVDTTSFVAVIAAAGFAVGLAFQGTLSNFAGGVLLLTLRPFRVGDYIEGAGYSGTVKAVQILYTELNTPDNKAVFIPNGILSNEAITNYSAKDTRRVDLKFRAKYDNDSAHVISVLENIVRNHPSVLTEPEPFIRLTEHDIHAAIYTVRAWVEKDDYWTVYFDLMESVKKGFNEAQIAIPYQQMDVHVVQENRNK